MIIIRWSELLICTLAESTFLLTIAILSNVNDEWAALIFFLELQTDNVIGKLSEIGHHESTNHRTEYSNRRNGISSHAGDFRKKESRRRLESQALP